jgi:dienelactone hydrolase
VAQGSVGPGDPFRAVARWAGIRGSYQDVTWTDHDGALHAGALFGPLEESAGRAPGVVVVCDVCSGQFGVAGVVAYLWITEALAEHGYIVFFPDVGPDGDAGNIQRTIDATDWFVSTANTPSPHGANEFNPWHARLDPSRLGINGHSSTGRVALNVGNLDERYDAVVAFDSGANVSELQPRVPTMAQLADYEQTQSGFTASEPRHTKPVPAPGSKFTLFDRFRDAGVDAMQIVFRAGTHGEWSTPVHPAQTLGGSLYGEAMGTYYTLAWFDHYLRGSNDALDRLTATSTYETFADRYSIGTGHFDALKATRAGDVEAGNVPITVGGLEVHNRLSWWYPSRYFLDGGKQSCDDMRGGCPS